MYFLLFLFSFMFFLFLFFFFFKQKTAYEMRISDWSSDVCSSDLLMEQLGFDQLLHEGRPAPAVHRVRQDALEIVACVDGLARSRLLVALVDKIGRASCRERVCQYV